MNEDLIEYGKEMQEAKRIEHAKRLDDQIAENKRKADEQYAENQKRLEAKNVLRQKIPVFRDTLFCELNSLCKLVYPKFYKKKYDQTGLWNKVFWYEIYKYQEEFRERVSSHWIRVPNMAHYRDQILQLREGDTVFIRGTLSTYTYKNEDGNGCNEYYPILRVSLFNVVKRSEAEHLTSQLVKVSIDKSDMIFNELTECEDFDV